MFIPLKELWFVPRTICLPTFEAVALPCVRLFGFADVDSRLLPPRHKQRIGQSRDNTIRNTSKALITRQLTRPCAREKPRRGERECKARLFTEGTGARYHTFLALVKSFPYAFKGSNCQSWMKRRFSQVMLKEIFTTVWNWSRDQLMQKAYRWFSHWRHQIVKSK